MLVQGRRFLAGIPRAKKKNMGDQQKRSRPELQRSSRKSVFAKTTTGIGQITKFIWENGTFSFWQLCLLGNVWLFGCGRISAALYSRGYTHGVPRQNKNVHETGKIAAINTFKKLQYLQRFQWSLGQLQWSLEKAPVHYGAIPFKKLH